MKNSKESVLYAHNHYTMVKKLNYTTFNPKNKED